MYWDMLRLRLPKGVLPYIEVIDEVLLLTQGHQSEQKSKFSKKQQMLHKQTIKINQVKQILHLNTITVHHKPRKSIHRSEFPDITQLFNSSNCFVHSSVW